MDTQRLTVTVEKAQVTALRKLAGEHGTNVGVVARAALTQALSEPDRLHDTIDACDEANREQRRAAAALGGIRRAENLGYREHDNPKE